jgi:hypothetical protein
MASPVEKFESQADAELQKLGEQLSAGRYSPSPGSDGITSRNRAVRSSGRWDCRRCGIESCKKPAAA